MREFIYMDDFTVYIFKCNNCEELTIIEAGGAINFCSYCGSKEEDGVLEEIAYGEVKDASYIKEYIEKVNLLSEIKQLKFENLTTEQLEKIYELATGENYEGKVDL